MEKSRKPVANPSVLLREEFDDWAVLFDADTSDGFGLSPTGVYLWKLLDGARSIDDMVTALRRDAADVPEEAGEQIFAFVEELAQHGLAAYNVEQVQDGRERALLRTTSVAENLPDGGREAGQLGSGMLRYERPRLELFTLETRAQGDCSTCTPSGNYAGHSGGCYCSVGTSPGILGPWCCSSGDSASGGGSSAHSCTNGTTATGGNYACGNGTTATGGGSYTCAAGNSGGSCTNGSNAH
jgi:SynChlorMet cassette protein ScmD